ncbi:bifunctional lysylphosphatidylglycerol flippase/synthetase MprF [Umezawaea endophytica]|uniref:DUF2156 domain-containing protein n=1 Tax=Umezawaea endophytica TaxID=1654476 RepID=A0A9X2VPX3_9PSEU|nr:DUF2156 domain-containing protein [Umezawaea endophytica]MCS7480693.1 DUF2156 domain-containing protein [Umezawaea endophytica]
MAVGPGRRAALARGAHRLGRLIRRAPFTAGLVALLWGVGAVTGSLLSGPPDELLGSVGFGTSSGPWTLVTSALWCMNALGYLATTALLVVFGPLAEREFGSLRAALVFTASHVLGCLAGAVVVTAGAATEWEWLTYLDGDVATVPSAGVVGLALALSHRLPAHWRRRVRLLLVIGLLVLALYSGYLEDVLRLAGGVIGLLLGVVAGRRKAAPSAPSHEETRVLVALLLTATALGPVVALLSPYANGPLAWFADVLAVPQPDADAVVAYCAEPDLVELCRTAAVQASYGRFPSMVMSVLPVLVLLALAEGLRRGRRFAWWGAVLVNLAMAGLLGWYVVEMVDFAGGWATPGLVVAYGVPFLLPVAMVVVLLLTRGHFPVVTPVRRFWALTVGGLLALSGLYVGGGYLVRDQFTPAPGFADLLADLPARFLPPGYLGLLPMRFSADDLVATVLFEYTGVVFWLVVLGAMLQAAWRARHTDEVTAAARARELVRRHGGTSLSYMTTWSGNHHWFTRDGRAVIAYRVVATIALTVGDPIGPPDTRREAVLGFAEFCGRQGWTPCLYSIGEELRDAVDAHGWSTVQVAEDTVIPLADLAFTGKKWQDVRTALNKAAKAGVTAEWWSYPDAPHAITDQVRAISEEWVADKGLPEMGFTLGGLEELSGEGVRCLVAVDADRTVHGVTSWLPVYRDGEVAGWTLDFMRRRSDGFRGSMEFLIASAATTLKAEGALFLSLSGAPLARLDRGERPCGLQRVLDFTGRVLEPVYGFRSLFAFKAKFQPVYHPMFMAYPDSAALPRIANAVSRAYLPDLSARQGLRLAGKVIIGWEGKRDRTAVDHRG